MLILLILSLVPFVVGKNELYMGNRVYRVDFSTQEQQDNFHLLKTDIIDYLVKPNFKYDITGLAMVPPSQLDSFEERLRLVGLEIDIAIEDVYEYLLNKDHKNNVRVDDDDEEENSNDDDADDTNTDENEDNNEIKENDNFDYDDFYRYDQILDHIYKLRDDYENDNSTNLSIDVIEFGRTEHDRPLVYLKISTSDTETNKSVIVIEAGMNPREWITIPAALYIVDNILEDQARHLSTFDWIVIPVLNPDGYEYTHTDLRFWEKNLSIRSNWGLICPGVNINRNFDIDWARADTSSSPCSHLYAGEAPFSEIESRLIQNIINTYKDRLSLYVSLQNGGGFISYPWQYEFAASGMFRENHLLGMEMVAAMHADYELESAAVVKGDRVSGTSSDYARKNGILYSFNIDMVNQGTDGVIVPETEIFDIVEDVWRAVAVAVDYLVNQDRIKRRKYLYFNGSL